MKKNFEELALLDHDVIAQKSHIVHSTLDDVIKKRFNKFNPVKAKGIANTLENEFNIDMSAWLAEYETYRNTKSEVVTTIDRVAIEAIEEKGIPKRQVYLAAAIAAGVIVFLFIIVSLNPLRLFIGDQNMSDADYKAELNKTEEANATNIALSSVSDQNSSLPVVGLPVAEKNTTQIDNAKLVEANKTTQSQPVVTKILIENQRKLWYRVVYLDNNKSEEATVEPGKFEIDGIRTKVIILGHQQNKITYGQTMIPSKEGAKVRFLLKDKKLVQISEEEEYRLRGKSSR